MAGDKAAAYTWRQCELSAFDTDLDEKMTSYMNAMSNPWQNIDKKRPCRKAWLISGYRCSSLPDELLGEFYTEEVYLLLSIKPSQKGNKDAFNRHLHLWVGKYASKEAYQTGIAWMMRLDAVLTRECTLYREVQGMESQQFSSYFNPITYLSGSFKDGYWMRRVRGDYQPARLFKLYKPDRNSKDIICMQVPCKVGGLDPAFTFVLDVTHTLFIWHGNLTPTEEDLQCTRYVEQIKGRRGASTRVEALDDDTELDAHEFFTYLSRDTYRDDGMVKDEHESSKLHRASTLMRHKTNVAPKQLFKITISKKAPSNMVQHDLKKEDKFQRNDIDKNAISLVNSVYSAIVVMNKKTSGGPESNLGIKIAHDFLKTSKTPLKPIIVLRYKQESKLLDAVLAS